MNSIIINSVSIESLPVQVEIRMNLNACVVFILIVAFNENAEAVDCSKVITTNLVVETFRKTHKRSNSTKKCILGLLPISGSEGHR